VIDYVKLRINSETLAKWFLNESPFKDEFYTEVYVLTGEVKEVNKRGQKRGVKYVLDYRELTVTIIALKYIEITGSLHKYWTAKLVTEGNKTIWIGQNYSDFTFRDLCKCIERLTQIFNLAAFQVHLHVLEVAVNITPSFNPFEFCSHVIASGKKPFKEMELRVNQSPVGFECNRQHYKVKIYDKGKKENRNENILRFEVRTNKMLFISYTGIEFFSDLANKQNLEKIGAILVEQFEGLIITDLLDTSQLTPKELKIYHKCSNPKMWEKLPAWERCRLKPQFRKIIKAYGKNQWVEPTAKLIADKWQMLLSINSETANVLTEPAQTKTANNLTSVGAKDKKTELQQINPLDKLVKNSNPTKTPQKPFKNCSQGIPLQNWCGKLKLRKNRGPPAYVTKTAILVRCYHFEVW
jgi:hypothetical protein